MGKALQQESTTIDQAGLHAYSQVFLVKAETLQGGMLINDSDDDKYQRAADETIPFMQESPNKVDAPVAPPAVNQDQVLISGRADGGWLNAEELEEDG